MNISLDKHQQTRFEILKFSGRKRLVKGNFPDYLIIGPQRTGTTWLEAQFKLHPEVFISYPKEIFFFSRLENNPQPFSKHYYMFNAGKALQSPLQGVKDLAKISYFDFVKTGLYKADELEWYLTYFEENMVSHRKKNAEMKALYGESYQPRVFGEATATYITLSEELIGEIKMINPELKVIIMVRDPIKRTWSHAKKDLMRYSARKMDEVPDEEFVRFFRDGYQRQANSYSSNIEKWTSILGKDQVFVGLYDHISQQPETLLTRVYDFLGVSSDPKYISPKVRERVNPTDGAKIPDRYLQELNKLYLSEKEKLARQFNLDWS